MIVWINGTFGAGKSTLAAELCRRRPDAALFDPELIGGVLQQSVGSPTGDFQDLPAWREVVAATLVSLRRHHAKLLVVPMTVVRTDYFDELTGPLRSGDEPILHVFLEADHDQLRRRLSERVQHPDDPDTEAASRAWAIERIVAGVDAPTRLLPGTLRLDSGLLPPDQLADEILTHLPGPPG